MHLLTLTSDDIYVRSFIPATWKDCPSGLLRVIAQCFLEEKEVIQCAILKYCIPKHFKHLNEFQVADIIAQLDFIDHPAYFPLVPKFRYKFINYHFSAPKMQYSTATEFTMADHYYQQFIETQDPFYARCVLACVARRKKRTTHDDKREKIHSQSWIESRAKFFTKVDPWILSVGMKLVSDTKHNISSMFKELFSSESNGNSFGWYETFSGIAETGIHGDIDQVYESNIYTLLSLLLIKKRENDRLLEKLNSN